jgi:hypothetical protein
MTVEEILKEFLKNEEFFKDNGYKLSEEDEKFSMRTNNKLVNVIKMAINFKSNNESNELIANKLNKNLN